MRLTPYLLRSVVVVAVVTNCRSSQAASGTLSEQDLAAVRSVATRDSAIVMARNWDALAAEYTTDAVRMPPNQPPVQGRDAIRRWLELTPPITKFSFHLVDLQGAGSFAFLRGSYTMTVAPPGGAPVSDSGKELVVLRRQADGSWLRVVDAWNSDLPVVR
jgi:ketosteroid isomerase-like protein